MKDGEGVTIRFKGNGPLGEVMADATNYTVRGFVEHPEVMLPLKKGKLDVGGGVGHEGVVIVTRCPGKGHALQRLCPFKERRGLPKT